MGALSLGRGGGFLGEGSILKGKAEHLLDQAVSWCGGSYRWRWERYMGLGMEKRILLFHYKGNPTIRAQ